jgi:nitric oxide reductase large subunit
MQTTSWLRIIGGVVLLGILAYFQYVRLNRSIAYYKRDREADVQTIFDGRK